MPAMPLEPRQAAVDHDFRARRERRIIACEEQGGLRDLDGLTEALQRHLRLDSSGRFRQLRFRQTQLAMATLFRSFI